MPSRPLYRQNNYIVQITRVRLEATRQTHLNQMLDEIEGGNSM